MRKLKKYFYVFALFAIIVAAVSGCGKKNKNTIDKDAIYREEELNISFPEGFEVERMNWNGEKLSFLGYIYDVNTGSKEYWGTANLDGSDMKLNEIDTMAEEGIYKYVNTLKPLSGGGVLLYLTEYKDIQDGEDFYSEVNNYLELYSADGKLIKTIDSSEYVSEEDWIQSMEYIDGKIVLFVGQKIVVFNENLEFEKEVKQDNESFNTLYKVKDGSYVISTWDDEGDSLYRYDVNEFKKGEKIEVPFNIYFYSVMSGENSGYDLLLCDTNKIYGYSFGDAEPKVIMNFIDSDIYYSYFNMFAAIGNGEFISSSTDWSGDYSKTRICKYTKVAPEDYVEKKVITLGALYIWDSVKQDVIKFNKTNPDYRITIIDYDSYSTEDDWEAGRKKFNSDISSGQGPDIIIANELSDLAPYASKGLFVDLRKYMESDSDIDVNDIFPNVLDICSVNNKVFCISPVFYLQTTAAKKSVLNGRTSWTIQELIDFEKSLPEGTRLLDSTSRNSFLREILNTSGTSFINEKEATCNFNSAEFVALLEYVKTLPEEEDYGDIILYEKQISDDNEDYYTKWRDNKVVLYETYLSDIRSYNYIKKGVFGEDIELIGYPSSDGNGSIMYFSNLYAISAKGGNADAAWEFVRQYFTKEALSNIEYGFPIYMSRFDELAEQAKKKPSYTDYEGNVIEYDEEYYINGEYIPLECITDSEVQDLKKEIMSINKSQLAYNDILPIIEEETAYFFEGQKSAQDVADIIQSRISIYLKEKQ